MTVASKTTAGKAYTALQLGLLFFAVRLMIYTVSFNGSQFTTHSPDLAGATTSSQEASFPAVPANLQKTSLNESHTVKEHMQENKTKTGQDRSIASPENKDIHRVIEPAVETSIETP